MGPAGVFGSDAAALIVKYRYCKTPYNFVKDFILSFGQHIKPNRQGQDLPSNYLWQTGSLKIYPLYAL